jgi:ABC-type proline/glycine betaine transport system substrate-binding protein
VAAQRWLVQHWLEQEEEVVRRWLEPEVAEGQR